MQSDDAGGVCYAVSDLVYVEIGCVGGKYGLWLASGFKRFENLLLYVHVFKNGFNDEVGLGQRAVIAVGVEAGQQGGVLCLRNQPAFQ